jgi:tetratricopeptide (TPR) repeat protein
MAAGGASSRVAVNLGLRYMTGGEPAKAEAMFRRVLRIAPDNIMARNSLADVLYRQGKSDEAKALFAAAAASADEARKEYPRTWLAALNLAHIRHNEGDDAAALQLLQRARADYPNVWEIARFESQILRQTRGPDAALPAIAAFARDNWWHHDASLRLGQLLAEKGDADSAIDALQFASWLDVHDAQSLNLVALVRLRQNRLEESRAAQVRAVSRQPDEPSQYRLLADILLKMGCDGEAREALAKMASLEAVGRAQVAAN